MKGKWARDWEKAKLNPMLHLNRTIACSIRQSLRNNKNGKSGKHWENIVNFTLSDLIKHLEKQFNENMSWNNYGRDGWGINHIRPVSNFSFNSYKDEEFKKCWALENLQPLWAEENLRKSNKILENRNCLLG